MQIQNKRIGSNEPTFIIAEIGINHNGNMKLTKKLIDMAVECGCDAVKFQKRTIDIVYTQEELAKERITPFGKTNGDLKRHLEFGYDEYKEIDKYCKKKGIIWFASPWDTPSVDFLEQFDIPCYKVASACLTDMALLERIKETNKPILLSTGMSTIEEIINTIHKINCDNLAVLHCTSTYPTDLEELNLDAIKTLKAMHFPVGYSGHERGIMPSVLAVVMGACIVERHITLDRTMFGSDQAASLEHEGLYRMIRDIRNIPIVMGDGVKKVYDSEIPIREKLRRVK